ncbi:COG4315 family predicted lipoprotein [Streptomyces globisporus]|uniref:COG4315 family predicted lipoprotein n=1 Tax=Streptomyces globisporus TaxID=1908 RepID=UPI0038180B37
MFGNRFTGVALASTAAMLVLSSCAFDQSEPSSDRAAAPQPNSNTDFDGTFLTGTATDNGAAPNTGDLAPPREQRGPVARRWVQISADPADPANGPMRNGAQQALYFFARDTPSSGTSACEGACADSWPPVVVDPRGTVFVDRVPQDAIGHFVRRDGLTQLTVEGRPVYRYGGDTLSGQIRGHGIDGVWFAAAPSGRAAALAPDGQGGRPGTGGTAGTDLAASTGGTTTRTGSEGGPR